MVVCDRRDDHNDSVCADALSKTGLLPRCIFEHQLLLSDTYRGRDGDTERGEKQAGDPALLVISGRWLRSVGDVRLVMDVRNPARAEYRCAGLFLGRPASVYAHRLIYGRGRYAPSSEVVEPEALLHNSAFPSPAFLLGFHLRLSPVALPS